MANVETISTNNARHEAVTPDRLTLLAPRNVWIDGHRTSVKLEPVIWDALRKIAEHQGRSVHDLVTDIDHNRLTGNLTSAVRAYVVGYLTAALNQA